jgi:hypothetical protein
MLGRIMDFQLLCCLNEYDLIPEHVVKIVHIRKKYGPCGCEGSEEAGGAAMLTTPGPLKILPGSDFTNRSTAFFITGKYADGIPFYRMEKMLITCMGRADRVPRRGQRRVSPRPRSVVHCPHGA